MSLWWYNGGVDSGAVALPALEWGSAWETGGLAEYVGARSPSRAALPTPRPPAAARLPIPPPVAPATTPPAQNHHSWQKQHCRAHYSPSLPPPPPHRYVGIPYDTVEEYTTYPTDGVAQSVKAGTLDDIPFLYACGGQDTADLCKDVFNTETAALIGGNYTYLRVDSCGHNVLGCSDPSQFISAIVENIESAYT